MKKSLFFSFFILLVGCKTPSILVAPELKSNTSVYEVKGKQGWQFNQIIRYGDYATSKIKRSWTSRLEIPFIVRFQKAGEKLSFTQYTPDNQSADVYTVGKFESHDLPLLNGYLNYSLKYQNSYAGTIIPVDSNGNYWDFLIYNVDGGWTNNILCGNANDSKGNEIIIEGVTKIEGQASWMHTEFVGYEFFMNGQYIGAVSNLNNGRIWIKDDVNPDIKLVISSISTSILVKHNLTDSKK